ncbi:HAD family hydrolase [Salinigranum rubrum]|uniref:HAD family hydrolase n=1 Tax=Salinigranum rubrum TaxID=755307 RepID=A0A2I8VJG1_9EURY|nr:HAD family hydrolase [Salinigranum rubrum]AUV82034.1 HAD family hydrolase [Salinigranum rubrum]
MPAFDAVLFDLDNTLCRHEQSAETIYFGAFERADIEPVGTPSDLWEALDGDPPPDDPTDYLADGFARVSDQYGVSVDARRLAEGFRETVDYRAVSFVSGAERALAAASEHGPVGLITNGPSSRQRVKLDALGIGEAFDVVVYAGDLPRRKPYPDPFEDALDALDVRSNSALYVGDSVEHDVVGAQRAGIPVAWFADGGEWDERWNEVDPPAYVLDRMGGLADVLGDDASASTV